MWTFFKASLDQLIAVFHQTSLFGCQGSLEISLHWTSNTMKDAFLIDIDRQIFYFGSEVLSRGAFLLFYENWRPYREITWLLFEDTSQLSNP